MSVSDTNDRDRGLLSLIDRLMKRPESPAATTTPAVVDDGRRDGLDPVVPDDAPAMTLEPQIAVESTRRLGRTELAAIIQRRLQAVEGCPANGVEVTVYGARPWNAMLRFTPAAGPVDAGRWRAQLQDMVMLLREQYEVADGG
jgi:hypothetical protein